MKSTQGEGTVWKSTIKRYHAEIFSVKSNSENLLNLLLQMHEFLSLGDVSGSRALNTFCSPIYLLELLLSK